DAAARIELVWRWERARRADVEAPPAGSAVVLAGRIWRHFGGGEDGTYEEPGAMLARYEIRALALPAAAGRGRQRLLHQWRRVDIDLDLRLCGPGQHAGYLLQSALDDVVIVLALRIARHRSGRRISQHG